MADKKFSLSKALDFSGLQWFKSFKIGFMILGIGFVGLTIYRGWFMKTTSSKQIFSGKVEKVVVHEEQDRGIQPFFEVYTSLETSGEWIGGIRVGVHW